jgi:four helix bundle protein
MIEQLRDSATSVSANIREGKFTESTKEYIRYFEIALRSGNEAIHWLNLFKDTLEGDVAWIIKLITELEEILKVLAASIISLRKKRKNQE